MKIVGSAPVSNKVSNGAALGIVTGLVAAALQYFIPAWHSGIPQFAQLLITAGIGGIGYFGGGWASKHQATVTEIGTAIRDAESILSLPRPLGVVSAAGGGIPMGIFESGAPDVIKFTGSGGFGGAGGGGGGTTADSVARGGSGSVSVQPYEPVPVKDQPQA
jgi:hypothetical protein